MEIISLRNILSDDDGDGGGEWTIITGITKATAVGVIIWGKRCRPDYNPLNEVD